MKENGFAPQWVHATAGFRNVAVALSSIGVVGVLALYGCPQERLELARREIDHRIAQSNEAHDMSLRESEALLAQHEARRRATPSLEIVPAVIQSPSQDDVREIRLELSFSNAGEEMVAVKEITVTVVRGSTTREVYNTLMQTKEFAKAKRMLSHADGLIPAPQGTGTDENDTLRRQWAQKIIYMHDVQSQCFHGRLFRVSPESAHVTWEELPDVKTVRKANHSLAPGESVLEQFDYLLTEAQTSHWTWFRFRIAVNNGSQSERVIEFNLPGRLSQDLGVQFPTVVNETSDRAVRWEPALPLLPVIKDP